MLTRAQDVTKTTTERFEEIPSVLTGEDGSDLVADREHPMSCFTIVLLLMLGYTCTIPPSR